MKFCKKLQSLHAHDEPLCLTIYAGTSEDLEQESSLDVRLNQHLQQSRGLLSKLGVAEGDIDQLMAPVEALLDDDTFWNQRCEGIALFRSPSRFEALPVPFSVPERTILQDHFYLEPLVPMLAFDNAIFVLCIEEHRVRLLEMNRQEVEDLTPDDMPQSLEQIARHHPENLGHFHHGNPSGDNLSGEPVVTGTPDSEHPGNNREIRYFCEAIAESVNHRLRQHEEPLYLCTDAKIDEIFRSATNSDNLRPSTIPSRPGPLEDSALHAVAWSIHDREEKANRALLIDEAKALPKGTRSLNEADQAFSAARRGRVQLTIISEDALDQDTEHYHNGDGLAADGLGRVAIETTLHGGKLLLANQQELNGDGPLLTSLREPEEPGEVHPTRRNPTPPRRAKKPAA